MLAVVATGPNLLSNSCTLTGCSSLFLFLQRRFSTIDGSAHVALKLLSGNRLPENLAVSISAFTIPFHSRYSQTSRVRPSCVPSSRKRSSRGRHPIRVTGAKSAVFRNQIFGISEPASSLGWLPPELGGPLIVFDFVHSSQVPALLRFTSRSHRA